MGVECLVCGRGSGQRYATCGGRMRAVEGHRWCCAGLEVVLLCASSKLLMTCASRRTLLLGGVKRASD